MRGNRPSHYATDALSYLSCAQYLWAYAKNSTRAERLCCSLAVLMLALCVTLVTYFTLFYTQQDPESLRNEPWYITREKWLASSYNNTDIEAAFEPLRLVVIQHSVSTECYNFDRCASELRNLQDYFIYKKDRDIPYNFLIGNDGRAYEGRGWQKEGAHTMGYNRCSVGIGFIGDYREEAGSACTKVTELQQKRFHMLIEYGIQSGFLHPDYKVIGARDVGATSSPGVNLYKAMQKWPHYEYRQRFRNKTCEEINDMPFP